MSKYETIKYEVKAPIATVTLNRPERRNALNTELCTEMADALLEAEADENIRVIVLTGAPPVFCAGQDLKFTYKQDPAEFQAYGQSNQRAQQTMRHLKKAVIARVNGDALGGGTYMATACDIVVAVSTARFAMREINAGLTSTGAHFYTIGMRRALEMSLTGRYVFADEAERWGLINKAVPADKLDQAVNEYAEMIANLPPLGVMYTKQVNAFMWDNVANMQALRPMQQVISSILHKTEDRAEAQRSVLEKRKPVFNGR
ncbi:MAG: enoyl-CoA hydratase/isomerase family protein [Chloroflexota bacterium]|nr:enoyl-CoA hydratase/isomerase family protein [Chloroflexota bacterium]